MNRTALQADSSIKIQKRGKSVIMFYVFLLFSPDVGKFAKENDINNCGCGCGGLKSKNIIQPAREARGPEGPAR